MTFLMLEGHRDDAGMHDPPEIKTDTTVSFRPGSNPEYYDIIGSELGFQFNGRKRVNINYSQTFAEKNERYVRVKTQGKPAEDEAPFTNTINLTCGHFKSLL